jgi:hypothetical protein
MSDKRQKNQLVLAFTEEGRSEAPNAPQEGTESFTAKCETERPASHERLMEEVCAGQLLAGLQASQGEQRKSGNRRHKSRRALGLPEAALALHTGTAVARDLPTTTGATGGNPEAGWRGAKAWHPDGAGSFDPAGGDAGSATQMGPDLLRTQSRIPAPAHDFSAAAHQDR